MDLVRSAVGPNIPALAIGFVTFLLLYKLYAKIRSKFKVVVNCWFCNQNARVPYDLRNHWDCPSCEQYNGFTQDGDYNREIPGQVSYSGLRFAAASTADGCFPGGNGNGLCETCNEHQRIKVEKLAQFEPRSERTFEKELEKYRTSLEQKYRLCVSCERHVSKVLREKKKMILGSKLAAFAFEKINVLKIPQIRLVKYSRRRNLKQWSAFCLLVLGLVNFVITLSELNVKRDQMGKDFLSQAAFVVLSHLVALGRVLSGYIRYICGLELIERSYLYARTLVILGCYTLGMPLGKPLPTLFVINSWSVSYGSILLAFVNNVLDGFKLGKSALLLTVWSIYAGVANSSSAQMYGTEILKVLTSVATIVLAFPSFKSSDKILLDSTASSFHRIYAEDYLSDDTREKESSLSSTLLNNSSKSNSFNSSGNSVKSFSGKSIGTPRVLSPRKHNSEFSSSFNLNSPVPSASFRQYMSEEPTLQNSLNRSLSSSFLNSTMQSCRSEWSQAFSTASQASFATCAPFNQTLNADLSIQGVNNSYAMAADSFVHSQAKSFASHPPSSPVSFSSNNSFGRRSLLSPSRLGAQAFVVQPSWVSGGYFNSPSKFGQKNYFLETASPKDNVSRASSQSSGFESQGSSQSLQNGEQMFSRENSHCPEEHCSSQYDGHFDRFSVRAPIENSVALLPQLQSEKSFSTHLDFSQKHLPLTVSPAPSCRSLGSNCFSNRTAFNNSSNSIRTVRNTASPFDDLNKMSEDLPCIQKGSLLRKWKEKNLVL